MICTRGTSPTFSRDPRDAENRFMAFAVPFGSVATREQPRRTIRFRRLRGTARRGEGLPWLDLVRGLYGAYDAGAETALLLDDDGNVAEGPGFNVFGIASGALMTPARGVLPGITRRTVFDLVPGWGCQSPPARSPPTNCAQLTRSSSRPPQAASCP